MSNTASDTPEATPRMKAVDSKQHESMTAAYIEMAELAETIERENQQLRAERDAWKLNEEIARSNCRELGKRLAETKAERDDFELQARDFLADRDLAKRHAKKSLDALESKDRECFELRAQLNALAGVQDPAAALKVVREALESVSRPDIEDDGGDEDRKPCCELSWADIRAIRAALRAITPTETKDENPI